MALQSDLMMRNLDTVVVAPLEPAASGTFADRLNPRIELDGQPFVLMAMSVLGTPRASTAGARDAVFAALDLLSTGF